MELTQQLTQLKQDQKRAILTMVNRSLPRDLRIDIEELNKLIEVNKDEYALYIRNELSNGRMNSTELIAEKTLELLKRSEARSSSKSSSKSRSKSKSPLGSGSRKGGRKSKKSRTTKRRR
jgi:hypothetical protein